MRRDVASLIGVLALGLGCVFAPAAVQAQAPLAFRASEGGSGRTGNFALQQLSFSRVRSAKSARENALRKLFESRGISYPASEVFLRAFKRERTLELWARHPVTGYFVKVTEYPICALSGDLGPKRRQGDEQVPEGFYHIDTFNPQSHYHLSLGLDYPNRADRMRTHDASLGGSIFIHGDCKTIGCLPMTDEKIEELYWLAVQARDAGQKRIPVHIFPARMDEDGMALLDEMSAGNARLRAFWHELKIGYDAFESSRQVPDVQIDDRGHYEFPRFAGLPIDWVEKAARSLNP